MYQWSVCTRFGMVLFNTNEYHGPTCVGGGRKKWQKLKLIVYCFSRDNKRIQKRISVSCVRTIGRNACLTPASHASHKSLDLCLGNVDPFLLDMTPEVSYGVAKHSAIWDCAADLIPTVLYRVEIRATGWPWIHPSNVFIRQKVTHDVGTMGIFFSESVVGWFKYFLNNSDFKNFFGRVYIN